MRKIKFRAFDTVQQKMFSAHEMGQDELSINPDGRGFFNPNPISTRLSCYFHQLIPLQFSGLTDKNGADIYEGDVLYSRHEDSEEEKGYGEVWNEVVFHDGAFGWIGETTGQFHSFCDEPLSDAVVVGNIYKNPELLSKNEPPVRTFRRI